MCESIATTREHAPPKCIFPEKKDTPDGKDFRKNLIKVPSCNIHNTEKSQEDSYLMHILPTSIGINDVGINQFLTKVQRAIERRPALFKQIGETAKTVLVHDTIENKWFQAAALHLDMSRIHKVIEMNARAIYFHEHGEKFTKQIKIQTNFTLDLEDPNLNESQEKIFKMSDFLLEGSHTSGENPEVFFYRSARDKNIELLEFTYYGQSKAIAVLDHSQSV